MSPQKKQNRPTSKSARRYAGLRSSPAAFSERGKVSVDAEAGIIAGVALLTVGPTVGHGFSIDSLTIDQLVALAVAQEPDGVKCRFKHPEIGEKPGPDGKMIQTIGDDSGSLVGRIKNVRRDGDVARGDVHLGSYAEIIPGMGNVKEYLLRHAETDPSGIGLSAMFEFDIEPELDPMGNVLSLPARLTTLYAIDFVGQAAANRSGLLCASPSPSQSPPPPAIPPDDRFAARHSCRACLEALVKDGPLPLAGLVGRTRFNGRWQNLQADVQWLVNRGYAEKLPKGLYKETREGMTQAAMSWK